MLLTFDFQPYDGDYQKKMQDIKLYTGEVYEMCWPNAGVWNVCDSKVSPIPDKNVVEVRLNKTYGHE